MKIRKILEEYPFANNYFEMNNLDAAGHLDEEFKDYINFLDDEFFEELATDRSTLIDGLDEFIKSMLAFLGKNDLDSITILPGHDKDKNPEGFSEIVLKKSDIISIVGPTGSGKSRLLADIEWMAQADTPTGRTILINGQRPSPNLRFSTQEKLVAQLSQNMNFVMDLSVKEFIELHCKSRLVDPDSVIDKIISDANRLAGESFSTDTNITALSGGQSRALMISDTANISKSPIVLIDEIENAGIDRKSAIELLISEEKIVIMATHDPTLALIADRRIVIKNGAIEKIIHTDEDEKKVLNKLQEVDDYVNSLREKLRRGHSLN